MRRRADAVTDQKKTDVEEIVGELLEDPDSADKGNRATPQTIDAEPSEPDSDGR